MPTMRCQNLYMHEQTGAGLPPRPSIGQVAEYLGTHPKTIRRWIAAGRLTAHRVGPRLLRLDRDEWLQLGRPVGGAA
ncbi:MAG: helix-turn-helix domain-containing protein [Mycobacterium sp.]|uniref:excisionase family DNA-binding protein n=1 Tax=Mycobacterium sp. TaxID=1785 RepID=UPI003C740876